VKAFIDAAEPPRPAARAIRSFRSAEGFGDSVRRPFLHLIDGGVSDNVGMRSVIEALEVLEALHDAGRPTPLDRARRIIVFVVNSLSQPPTNWDASEEPPNSLDIMLKSAGVPIDHFSYESIELLKDMAARWQTIRRVRKATADAASNDPELAKAVRVPDAEIYAIDVSFPALADKSEVDFLNRQPTSFVLSAEAVDRLRAAAGRIILASPDFQRLLKDAGATIVADPAGSGATAIPAAR
jgi:NTE family protein